MSGSTEDFDTLFADIGERLDHQEGPELEEFSRYRWDPVAFIGEVLGDDLWRKQRDVAMSVVGNDQTAVQSCNASGKSFLNARVALWWCYAHGGLAIITGSTQAQLTEQVMRSELHPAFRSASPSLPGDLHITAVRPSGVRAGVLAKTATSAAKLGGFHDDEVLVVIDEAQAEGMAEAFEAAMRMTGGDYDRLLATGNPERPAGAFYRACQPDSGWNTIRIGARDVPNYREGRTVIPGLLTRKMADRIANFYGRESAQYRYAIRGKFPDEIADGGLYARHEINRAVQRGQDDALEEGGTIFALDPAGKGPNSSVLGWRAGPVVKEFTEWDGPTDTSDLVYRVRAAMGERGLADRPLVVDATGVGAHVVDRLAELGTWIVPFRSGSTPDQPDRYLNKRAEAFWRLRLLLEEAEIALPDDEELARQLLAHRYTTTPGGLVQIEKKSAIRGRLGAGSSPDRADVLAMLFAWPAPPPRDAGADQEQEAAPPGPFGDNFIPDDLTKSPI